MRRHVCRDEAESTATAPKPAKRYGNRSAPELQHAQRRQAVLEKLSRFGRPRTLKAIGGSVRAHCLGAWQLAVDDLLSDGRIVLAGYYGTTPLYGLPGQTVEPHGDQQGAPARDATLRALSQMPTVFDLPTLRSALTAMNGSASTTTLHNVLRAAVQEGRIVRISEARKPLLFKRIAQPEDNQ
ncbi:hypothetical protein ACTSKR_11485 [Chitinibacteraceae bacterium HSL-7]